MARPISVVPLEVLQQVSDGAVSGAEVAREYGISRQAVAHLVWQLPWKAIPIKDEDLVSVEAVSTAITERMPVWKQAMDDALYAEKKTHAILAWRNARTIARDLRYLLGVFRGVSLDLEGRMQDGKIVEERRMRPHERIDSREVQSKDPA